MGKNSHRPAHPGKQLTGQQREFLQALSADPKQDQTKAAIKAGYSPKTAKGTASKLMNLPCFAHVQAAYKALVDSRMARYNVTNERIIQELSIIALGDRSRISRKEDGKVIIADSDELFPDERVMVEGYREKSKNDGTDGTMIEVIQHSKVDALKTLAKIRGMLRERHEVKLDVSISASRQIEQDVLGKLAGLAAARGASPAPEGADAKGTGEPGEDILGGLAKLAAFRNSESVPGGAEPGTEDGAPV